MFDAEKFGLKPNPFHHLVTEENAQMWAGMPEPKRLLHDVVQSVSPDDIGASEFVILLGGWGGGKTHALRYFERQIQSQKLGHPFFVSGVVRSGKDHMLGVFRTVIDECGDGFWEHLEESVNRSLFNASSAAKKANKLEEIIDSNFSPVDAELVRKIKKGNVRDHFRQGVKDDFSAAVAMASLVRVMTASVGGQSAPYSAAYLFLDEMEEMVQEKPAVALSFWRSCRELVNRIDGRFVLIFAMSEETAVVDATIPPYLMERVTRPYIQMGDFDLADAKGFVKDFLRESRISGFVAPHPFYPFSENAVDFMLDRESSLLPRKIIMMMGRVFKRGRAKLGNEKEFSKEIAEEVLTEMGL